MDEHELERLIQEALERLGVKYIRYCAIQEAKRLEITGDEELSDKDEATYMLTIGGFIAGIKHALLNIELGQVEDEEEGKHEQRT